MLWTTGLSQEVENLDGTKQQILHMNSAVVHNCSLFLVHMYTVCCLGHENY